MRVIAGTARSMPLKCIEGLDTRPTTDRIKETLFNMLQPEIPGCRFLDLFGGSGAIGIEALSRGADFAAFAENNKKAYECILANLAFTRLADRSRVFFMDALGALRVMEEDGPFDLIFLDPPYGRGGYVYHSGDGFERGYRLDIRLRIFCEKRKTIQDKQASFYRAHEGNE